MSTNKIKLMDFPAELRNYIYDCAIADEIDEVRLTRPKNETQAANNKNPNPRLDPRPQRHSAARKLKRPHLPGRQQFIGLAQTCKALRAEFLPLHRAKVTHVIDLRDLDEYIKDMIRAPFKTNENAFGKLSISLIDVDNARQNLKPLIDICFAANQARRNFRASFQGLPCQEAIELNQILGCGDCNGGDGKKWELYYREAVFTVSLSIQSRYAHPYFYIRMGHDQELIAGHVGGAGGHDGRAKLMEEWESKAGLCFPVLRKETQIYTLGRAKTRAGGAGTISQGK